MSLREMLPSVRSLPHSDKIRLLRFLADELAHDEEIPSLHSETEYTIWTPLPDSGDAARTLSEFLQASSKTS